MAAEPTLVIEENVDDPVIGNCSLSDIEFAKREISRESHFQKLLFVGMVAKENLSTDVQARLFVMGEYTLLSAKRFLGSMKIVRSGHMYDIVSITTNPGNQLIVDWPTFCMKFSFSDAEFVPLVTRLLRAYSICTNGKAAEDLAVIDLSGGYKFTVTRPLFKFGGFAELVKAHVCWLDLKSVDYADAIDKLYEMPEEPCLRLNKLPNMRGQKSSLIDLRPLVFSLVLNKYFTAIDISDCNRPEAVGALAVVLRRNTTVTEVNLARVGASKGFRELGKGLSGNPSNNLTSLNLSGNKDMGDRGLSCCAAGLADSPLVMLNLEDCGLRAKGISFLVEAFSATPRPCSITALNLANNKLGRAGSEALGDWMQSPNAPPLQTLLLRNTALKLEALNLGPNCTTLQVLDVSENKLPNAAVASFVSMLNTVSCVEEVNISRCSIKHAGVFEILTALVANPDRKRPAFIMDGIDLSSNRYLNAFNSTLAEMKPCCPLSYLSVADCSMTAQGLSLLLETMMVNCHYMTRLNVGGNVSAKKDKAIYVDLFVSTLRRVVTTIPLRILEVEGNPQRFVGTNLSTFFTALYAQGCTVKDLHIAGQKIGDHGATILRETLQNQDCQLVHLDCDDNDFTVAGFEALSTGIIASRSILSIKWPEIMVKELEEDGNRLAKQARLTHSSRVSAAAAAMRHTLDENRARAEVNKPAAPVMPTPEVNRIEGVSVAKADNAVLLLAKERGVAVSEQVTMTALEVGPSVSNDEGGSGGKDEASIEDDADDDDGALDGGGGGGQGDDGEMDEYATMMATGRAKPKLTVVIHDDDDDDGSLPPSGPSSPAVDSPKADRNALRASLMESPSRRSSTLAANPTIRQVVETDNFQFAMGGRRLSLLTGDASLARRNAFEEK